MKLTTECHFSLKCLYCGKLLNHTETSAFYTHDNDNFENVILVEPCLICTKNNNIQLDSLIPKGRTNHETN